jgi:hypothetical protein
MTALPPPPPPKTGMSRRRKIVFGVVGVLVALGVIGALAPPDNEVPAPVAAAVSTTTSTTMTPTTVASTTTPTTVAPPKTTPSTVATTVAPVDEYRVWMLSQLSTVLDLAADMQAISPLLDAGDYDGAADLSTAIGESFRDLYMAAPETGTEASDVGNDMLLTCSLAYTLGGAALASFDLDALEDATERINECSDLLSRSSELMQ